MKSLIRSGVDLIAKEAEYHKSCRIQFDNETGVNSQTTIKPAGSSFRQKHNLAFLSVCEFVEEEIIKKQRPILSSALFDLYKDQYISSEGNDDNLSSYTAQHLVKKLSSKFGSKLTVSVADRRRGNVLHNSVLSTEEAKYALMDDVNSKQEDQIRAAALLLRGEIMKIPKTKTPHPTTIQGLKDEAPKLPESLALFFRTLLCGLKSQFSNSYTDTVKRKVVAMSSDAVYNVSRGQVKPWKHTLLGLGLGSITGSKLTMQILNKEGHAINYNDVKSLETEFAYSALSEKGDAPDGILKCPSLATACVWDNYDANIETLDGKATLHVTVGHSYQNANQMHIGERDSRTTAKSGRNRRSYVGLERDLAPFRIPLKTAQFQNPLDQQPIYVENTTDAIHEVVNEQPASPCMMKMLDLYWFAKARDCCTPLYAGFVSKFRKDRLPLQRICYMDPISKSPTNNEVVKETMVRTMNVAAETGQEYAVVTYDLAVAQKAFAIQAIEAPLFDKLLILLGNFHMDLAFFGAVGTFINDSGIEYILSETKILAEGSLQGFIKGKFYNRCTRVHEIIANVMERKLYDRFLTTLDLDETANFQQAMSVIPADPDEIEVYLTNTVIIQHHGKYEEYFNKCLNGAFGKTCQYWTIYIFLINRLYREMQRCVRMNDVTGYIDVLPMLLDIYFALNRPNYARWGSLFYNRLKDADANLKTILDNGAFSIRRTKKDYARTAVDLSLEQTVNRDAASQMKGIVTFRNSENAIKRWCVTVTQRAAAVTELRAITGLEQAENAAKQLRDHRIIKDNQQMSLLSAKIDEACNPFSDESATVTGVLNIATGRSASHETSEYLVNTLSRGKLNRGKFNLEWREDQERFHKTVKRIRVQNFAAENIKRKCKLSSSQMAKKNAESLRDTFIRMVVIVAEDTNLNLQNILGYPITEFPLSLVHCDGTMMKTNKAQLMQKLETYQRNTTPLTELPNIDTEVFDGGHVLHSMLSQVNVGTTYSSIARLTLVKLCSSRADEIHLCLDRYDHSSIKESERNLRGADNRPYVITGSEQCTRQSGKQLLKNSVFKNQLGNFLMKEWSSDHYGTILQHKTLIVSFGGKCLNYQFNHQQKSVSVSEPQHLQGDHEEADTLIAFHVKHCSGNILVRASDTDVLVILIGALGRDTPETRAEKNVFMDCGNGNSRRYIDVTKITSCLNEKFPGLAAAVPGCHAFTGCDYTAAFYR